MAAISSSSYLARHVLEGFAAQHKTLSGAQSTKIHASTGRGYGKAKVIEGFSIHRSAGFINS
jgi:hypothetical protein